MRSDQPVVTHLMGGLGNQMFQYAAGRALALRTGSSLKLDLSGCDAADARPFELDKCPIDAVAATKAELAALGAATRAQPNRLVRMLGRLKESYFTPNSRICRERHFHFDPAVINLRPPVLLFGHWQSERYFLDYADTIRCELTSTIELDAKNAAMAERIESVNAVSLHVRRGDYADNPVTNRYHGTCTVDYYQRSLAYLSERIQSPHIFVFSDDYDWARGNLRFTVPTTFIDINTAAEGYRDMQLMVRCRHHIIANSSFSWWGAWLSPRAEKVVVAPRRWFRTTTNDTRDLIPEGWIRL
jgi:hypothetical protein